MTSGPECSPALLPEEEVLDRLQLKGGGKAEFILTTHRLLAAGPSDLLGPHLTLPSGSLSAAIFLPSLDSFVLASGRRPLFFLLALALASAGGILLTFLPLRVVGLGLLAAAVIALLLWSAWKKTFLQIASPALKLTGQVNPVEALVFLERLSLAAQAAKAGKTPQQIREAVSFFKITAHNESLERLASSLEPLSSREESADSSAGPKPS